MLGSHLCDGDAVRLIVSSRHCRGVNVSQTVVGEHEEALKEPVGSWLYWLILTRFYCHFDILEQTFDRLYLLLIVFDEFRIFTS